MPTAADAIELNLLPSHVDMPPALAAAFQESPATRKQHAILVGVSLAAITGAIACLLGTRKTSFLGTACATSTMLFAWIWWRRMFVNTTFWPKLFISTALAASNAGTALVLVGLFKSDLDNVDTFSAIAFGLAAGATLGALIWAPALALTFAIFGYAIVQHTRAQDGNRDRLDYANQVTATTCLVLSSFALVLLALAWERGLDLVLPITLALSAMGAGLWGALNAAARTGTRQVFVCDVRKGNYPHLTYQATDTGGVILQRATEGSAYRQAEVARVIVRL
jgi:hypothetical protein